MAALDLFFTLEQATGVESVGLWKMLAQQKLFGKLFCAVERALALESHKAGFKFQLFTALIKIVQARAS